MLKEYNLGDIEMAGESYPSEIDYEVDPEDGAILIYAVRILKKVCEKDGVWYDKNGNFHRGEKWIRLDIEPLIENYTYGRLVNDNLMIYND